MKVVEVRETKMEQKCKSISVEPIIGRSWNKQ
jgi:hypothetical protein